MEADSPEVPVLPAEREAQVPLVLSRLEGSQRKGWGASEFELRLISQQPQVLFVEL